MFSRLHLNESREGFCRKGRGRSFYVDGPKAERENQQSQWRIWREESGTDDQELTTFPKMFPSDINRMY